MYGQMEMRDRANITLEAVQPLTIDVSNLSNSMEGETIGGVAGSVQLSSIILTINGTPTKEIVVEIPSTIQLINGTNSVIGNLGIVGGNTTSTGSSISRIFTLPSTGKEEVGIQANVSVNGSEIAGVYRGSFDIEVRYN